MEAVVEWQAARRALAERRYEDGWPLFEARRRVPWIDVPKIEAAYPEWTGDSITGQRVVVCAEQGFGDQIMFGRYLHRLAALGAQVVVACHPGFVGRWFRAAGAEVAPLYRDRPLPPADKWTLFGSLPLRLGCTAPIPARYHNLPTSRGGGIGVMARGNPANKIDRFRSLASPSAKRLLSLGMDLAPEATKARDFGDTATVIAGLDLVITVDTAVAHLAGALGKPCWVLLPRAQMDWRWNDGERSDWYPDFRLFRQRQAGDWRDVLRRVETALGEFDQERGAVGALS